MTGTVQAAYCGDCARRRWSSLLLLLLVFCAQAKGAAVAERLIDIPTRSGVTQRFLYLAPENAKAAVILFSGGQGELRLADDGGIRSSRQNFLVRTRALFADNGLAVVVIDAPSDRQTSPYLGGFRETAEHVSDIKMVMAWLRKQAPLPVWLVGTSRGTQSAAFIATQLPPRDGGADGIVLTSTILRERGGAVPEMRLANITVPVLVVHHEQDGCKSCPYDEVPRLMRSLSAAAKKELISVTGGDDQGDPCQPMAHHGFNGQEAQVVGKIAAWITSH